MWQGSGGEGKRNDWKLEKRRILGRKGRRERRLKENERSKKERKFRILLVWI